MTFDERLSQVLDLLRREQRVSYRALKRRFDLDDEYLEDLKAEIIKAKQLAVDEDGEVLVWAGDTASAPPLVAVLAGPSQAAPLTYTPPHLTEKILTSRSALEGERKQVSVLFADLKDSTELIKDLDPEAAQKLLDPAIHLMMAAVHRFEGTVNQVLGDGIMALFGAPIAHEDHALRACYAALAMQAAMREYTEEVRRTHGIPLQMRVGVNAGEVVVRTIGNDLHMDYSAVGQTTHLAARMEQLAVPGSIALTGATLRLVEGLVRVNALGPVPVKGLNEPLEVYELIGASGIHRRLQAAVARGLTKFVGRETEVESLHHALEQAGGGHGQVVAAVGEAGVGKSRLLYEFVQSHRTRGWLVLESASVSYGKATPYFPVIDLLKRYVHLEEGDDPRTIRAKATGQILTLDESLQETIPALLSLLDALPEDSPFAQLDPVQRRYRTLEALKRVLLRESQVQPLLLVFEDLHWIDSETRALLDNLVESLPTARLLLLVNYRPEYQHPWGSKTYYTQLRLDPLQAANADEFLAALLGNDAGLAPLKQLLIGRTEGNPFFLEESVRTLVETEVLEGEAGAYRLVQELPQIQVPATVQAILTARMDRLPAEEKRLLQTAAVIGTEVPFGLVQAIADLPEEALHRRLAHLQTAEFVYETNLYPEREYTFKHALTHEVAYGSLLQERRRVLHARIVEALESLAGDRVDEQVEQLAHHALRGEVWDKAVTYCRQAGARALASSANREAVACFEQALDALQHLPESRDTMTQGLDLRLDLRGALLALGEYGRIIDILYEAERLAEGLDDTRRLGWVHAFMARHFWDMGNLDRALVSARRVMALATPLEDVGLHAMANFYLALVSYSAGNYTQAIAALRQIVQDLTGDLMRERFRVPVLISVVSRAWLAASLAEIGAFAEGRARGEEAIRIAEAADHPYSLAVACWGLGVLYLHQGAFQKAMPFLDRGLDLCRVWNISQIFSTLIVTSSAARIRCGRIPEALLHLEQTEVTADPRIGHSALWLCRLSDIYLLAGRLEEAGALAQRAHTLCEQNQERGAHPWILRLLGDLALQHDPPDIDQAETHYQQALTLADELGMRPLQAHCHHGLGMLYRQVGRMAPARAELCAAIELYRAMDMTFWLAQAEVALTDVAK